MSKVDELQKLLFEFYYGPDNSEIARSVWVWVNRKLWEENAIEDELDLFFNNPGFAAQKISKYFENCMSKDDHEGIDRLSRLIKTCKSDIPYDANKYKLCHAYLRASISPKGVFPPRLKDIVRIYIDFHKVKSSVTESSAIQAIYRFRTTYGFEITEGKRGAKKGKKQRGN